MEAGDILEKTKVKSNWEVIRRQECLREVRKEASVHGQLVASHPDVRVCDLTPANCHDHLLSQMGV